MKTLQDYILEQVQVNEESSSKTITFNFKDLENEEETLKSLEGKEYCTIDDKKLTITVSQDNYNKLDEVVNILQGYTDTIMKSPERASHEDYAQKTRTFSNKMTELNNAIGEFSNTENNEDDKKDDKKDDKEEE